MKGMSSTWFSRQISLGLENGVELSDIQFDYRLLVLKPLHPKWLVELYNHMYTDEGKEIVANGGKKRVSLRYQICFKWSSIFGSVCRYMPSY